MTGPGGGVRPLRATAHTSVKVEEYRLRCMSMQDNSAPPLWYSLRLR